MIYKAARFPTPDNLSRYGPWAVVTGASSGIGLPQPVETCVAEALAALRRGRPIRITGLRILSFLTPRTLSVRMNGRMLAKAAQFQPVGS